MEPLDALDDLELLRRYAQAGGPVAHTSGSDDKPAADTAFAEIVRRRVAMVYSAALRQVRDRHKAEDVTQAVFLALSQKAAAVAARPGTVVSGWLLTATRYAAKDLLKMETRRKRHEQKAGEQSAGGAAGMVGGAATDDADLTREWEDLAPLLDDAMARLSPEGRDALTLRFFEGRSFKAVGERLGISEQAAKQRVFRGLEKLRAAVGRRGVRSATALSPEALGALLAAYAVASAPPQGLAAAATAAATGAAAVAAQHLTLAKGVVTLMAWTKTKIAAVAAAALLLIGGTSAVVSKIVSGPTTETVTFGPAGARPIDMPTGYNQEMITGAMGFPGGGVAEPYNGPPIAGIVVGADGRPAANAEVLLSTAEAAVSVYERPHAETPATRTGADGRFEFRPDVRPVAVLARTDAAVGMKTVAQLKADSRVTLEAWGRIEGVVLIGGKPAARVGVELDRVADNGDWMAWRLMHVNRTQTDDAGRYVFPRVAPGEVTVSRLVGEANFPRPLRRHRVQVAAGAQTRFDLGGAPGARAVVGRLKADGAGRDVQGLRFDGVLSPVWPDPPQHPTGWERMSRERQERWWADWSRQLREQHRDDPGWGEQFTVLTAADGSFRIDDVPPGKYYLQLGAHVSVPGTYFAETAAEVSREVVVPEAAGGPVDLGEVAVTVHKRLRPGDAAPDFAARDLKDNAPLKLADLRGRYVLLHFWSSQRQDTTGWERDLRVVADRFAPAAAAGRFVMLGVNTQDAPAVARRAARERGYTWRQATAAAAEGTPGGPPAEYFRSPAPAFLLDPQGRIIAKSVTGPAALAALDAVSDDLKTVRNRGASPHVRVRTAHLPVAPGLPTAPNAADPKSLPMPTAGDAARAASVAVVDGVPATMSGDPARLTDGRMPLHDNSPGENFFFEHNTLTGRLRVDLGKAIDVAQINTFSWHTDSRGAQVYAIYGSDGTAKDFDPAPKAGTDPAARGWTRIADIDTRPPGAAGPSLGGRHSVSIDGAGGTAPAGTVGTYRYLLFVTFVTEVYDGWGHTFFSEIDVVERK